jgi:hypothetical protein
MTFRMSGECSVAPWLQAVVKRRFAATKAPTRSHRRIALGGQRRVARSILLVGVSSLQSNLAAPAFATHSGVSRTAEESVAIAFLDSIIRGSLR